MVLEAYIFLVRVVAPAFLYYHKQRRKRAWSLKLPPVCAQTASVVQPEMLVRQSLQLMRLIWGPRYSASGLRNTVTGPSVLCVGFVHYRLCATETIADC